MNKALLSITLLFALLIRIPALSQTAGASIVSSIESKVASLLSNEARINSLKAQIDRLKQQKQDEVKAGNQRLNQKLEEIENSTVWQNRLKSAQSGWKEFNPGSCSAGGPPPICSANHWYRVSVSEAMAEYEALKQKELDRVRDNNREREESLEDRIDAALKEIAQLMDRNNDLRDEIIALSKQYKDRVMDEAKSMHRLWGDDLMQLIASKHHIEDRLNILSVKMGDLDKEESKATAELKDKIQKKTEEEKKALTEKINSNKIRSQQVEDAYQARISPIQVDLSTMKDRLQVVNRDLMGNLTEEVKTRLQAEKADLETRIASTERQLGEYEASFKSEMEQIQNENRNYADKVWKLTTNLPQIQNEALENLHKAFAEKRTILNDARAARNLTLDETGKLLLGKKEAYRVKNNLYVDKVNEERIRIMAACSKVSASCYGTDTHSEVVLNWNKVSGCVGEMESAHHSNDVVYGCEEQSPVYRQHYLALTNGMSDNDLQALQRAAGRTRYDLIFRKITN